MKPVSRLILLIGLFSHSLGAVELSLDQGWELYQSQNPGLQRFMVDQKSTQEDRDNILKPFLPSANAGAGVSRAGTPVFTTPTKPPGAEGDLWSYRGSVDLRWNLSPGLFWEKEKEILAAQSATLELTAALQTAKASFLKAYWQIQSQDRYIQFLEDSLKLARQRYDLTLAQYSRGLRSDLEVLAAQIAVTRDEPVLAKARAEQEKRLIALRLQLGFQADTPLTLTTPLPAENPALPDLHQVLQFRDLHPEVQRASLRLQLQENARALGQLSRLGPSLGVSTGYSGSLAPGATPGGGATPTDNFSFGLSLSLPLDGHLPGSSANSALGKLDDEVEKQKTLLKEAVTKAEVELRSLILDLQVTQGSLQNLSLSLKLQQQNTQKVQESFEQGKASLGEVDTARQELQKARLALENEGLNLLNLLIDLGVKTQGRLRFGI